MISTIEELEKRQLRVAIFPQKNKGEWIWTAGVYRGDSTKAEWVDSDNGLPRAGYPTYKEALDAVVNYCTNQKKRGKQR